MDVVAGESRGLPATLVANANRSGRRRPSTVSAADVGETRPTDLDRPRSSSDRQLHPVLARVTRADVRANTGLVLELRYPAGLFTVLDQSRTVLAEATPGLVRVVVADALARSARDGVLLFLEARTVPASPLVAADPAGTDLRWRFADASDTTVAEGTGVGGRAVEVAPLRLVGDDGVPERVFMAQVPGNEPSVAEVAAAVRTAGVPFTLVPADVANGDAWLQDQFQAARLGDGPNALPAVLHLPRAATSSAATPGAPNLRSFVDGVLPADDLAVVRDLWQVPIRLPHAGGTLDLGLAETYATYRRLGALERVVEMLTDRVRLDRERTKDPTPVPPVPRGDPYAQRVAVPGLVRILEGSTEPEPLRLFLAQVRQVVRILDQTIALEPGPPAVVVLQGLSASTPGGLRYGAGDAHVLRGFVDDLRTAHSSRNYGGNIEVTPPLPGSPRGITVTGSLHSPALRQLVTDRGRSPDHAEVYTDWLEVGHVDEVAAFVATGEDLAVLRASPSLALEILRAAERAQASGTAVTRLFRGKRWLHRASSDPAVTPHNPPGLHRRLASRFSPYDLSEHRATVRRDLPRPRGGGAFHDDRAFLVLSPRQDVDCSYAAMVTVSTLLAVCGATNTDVEHLFLGTDRIEQGDPAARRHWTDPPPAELLEQRLDEVLAHRLRGQRVRPVPVVFDVVDTFRTAGTLAVTPDLVNLLDLGGRVVLPRPYGPRMHPEDAIALLGPLLRERAGIERAVTPADLTTRGLDRTWHWTRAQETVFRARVDVRRTPFDLDYEEMALEIQRQVLTTPSWETIQPGYVWPPTIWDIEHRDEPWATHPELVWEDLRLVATFFRDGFPGFVNHPADWARGDTETAHPAADAYDTAIVPVMDAIRAANPGVFDAAGAITSTDWVRISIPEDTVDLFEVWTQLVLEELGLTVHWADSWYYHTHSGGLHCGTNALRRARF